MRNPSSHRLSVSERKDLGAFYTPSIMTDFMASWAIRGPDDTVLDPGCGDAAFLLSATRRLRDLGGSVGHQVVGIDLNPEAVATAEEQMAELGAVDARLVHGNFFSFSSRNLFPDFNEFAAVIGNPPYVRYQLFREDNRTAGLRAAARAGVILPQLASSWAPYLIHASTFLRPGGRLAMVLPGELLYVGYAAAVRSFLLHNLEDLTIITFDEKVFPGALEEVVIVLGTKGQGDGKLRVLKLQSLSDLEPGPESVLRRASLTRVEPGKRWLTALFEEESIAEALDVIERARYRPLGELGRVDIGAVTGANDFFVLTRDVVSEFKIDPSYLLPVVSKATHVQGTRFTEDDWNRQVKEGSPAFLLLINERVTKGRLAEYIAQGERRGLPSRYKCRVREPWYKVPYVKKPDMFLTYMNYLAPRLAVNDMKAAHTNTVHGVFLYDPLFAEPLATAFLNSATLLSAEIEGRSYGGGVLKLEPREATNILVPHLTPRSAQSLADTLPRVDKLVRLGRLDEASAIVDRIVLGKSFRRDEIEKIRSVLSALRARRLSRSRTS